MLFLNNYMQNTGHAPSDALPPPDPQRVREGRGLGPRLSRHTSPNRGIREGGEGIMGRDHGNQNVSQFGRQVPRKLQTITPRTKE